MAAPRGHAWPVQCTMQPLRLPGPPKLCGLRPRLLHSACSKERQAVCIPRAPADTSVLLWVPAATRLHTSPATRTRHSAQLWPQAASALLGGLVSLSIITSVNVHLSTCKVYLPVCSSWRLPGGGCLASKALLGTDNAGGMWPSAVLRGCHLLPTQNVSCELLVQPWLSCLHCNQDDKAQMARGQRCWT